MAYDSSGTGSTATQKKSRSFAPKQILATILIVLAVVLGFENTASTDIHLVGFKVNSPLWILVAASLVLGLLAGLLLGHKSRKSK